MADPAPKQLDYAPQGTWHSRKKVRRIILFIALLTLLLPASKFLPTVWRNVQLYYWQQRCLSFVPPADWSVTANSKNIPHEWSSFYSLLWSPGFNSHGTVFLGECRAPDGTRRLVAVDERFEYANVRMLFYRVFELGTPVRPPKEIMQNVGRLGLDSNAKVSFGKLDPANPSHFTIEYTHQGRANTIDGWLENSGVVLLQARAPAASQLAPSSQLLP